MAAIAVVSAAGSSSALALLPASASGRGFRLVLWGRDARDVLGVVDVARIEQIEGGFQFVASGFRSPTPCTIRGLALIDARGRVIRNREIPSPMLVTDKYTVTATYSLTADVAFDTPEAMVDRLYREAETRRVWN